MYFAECIAMQAMFLLIFCGKCACALICMQTKNKVKKSYVRSHMHGCCGNIDQQGLQKAFFKQIYYRNCRFPKMIMMHKQVQQYAICNACNIRQVIVKNELSQQTHCYFELPSYCFLIFNICGSIQFDVSKFLQT